jgi:hypothetical protein
VTASVSPTDEAQPPGWPFRSLLLPSLLLAVGALAAAAEERPHLPEYGKQIFRQLFARHELAAGLLLIAILLTAGGLARFARGRELVFLERIAARRAPIAILAAATFAGAALLAYAAHPLSMDEYAAYFQAQIFAAGSLTGQFPPELLPRLIPISFVIWFLTPSLSTGQIVSSYWPGFALMLTPFVLVGIPWALNPLLGAGILLALARLARRWIGEPAAPGWVIVLTLASPAVLINAASFYSMTAHLLANLVWMDLVTEGRATDVDGVQLTRSAKRLVAAGVVGSLALVLHNPMPHGLFTLPWLLALFRRRGLRAVALLGLGYLPLGVLLGVGWVHVRGSLASWTQPVGSPPPLLDRLTSMGRGLFVFPDAGQLWDRVLSGIELMTWSAPFLVPLAAVGLHVSRRGSPLRLLAASALVALIAYSLIPFNQGHGWGDRYFHPSWGVLPLLSALALVDPRARRWRRPVLAAALLALVAANGLRLWQVDRFVERHLAQLPPLPAEGRAVCFLHPEGGSYVSDLYQNDPFLRNQVWILISYGADRDAELMRERFPGSSLIATHPNATVWRVP